MAIYPKQKDCPLIQIQVQIKIKILLQVLEKNPCQSEACLGRQSELKIVTKTNQLLQKLTKSDKTRNYSVGLKD